ncbi:MAG: isoaspartyl peptidase/L-asparaginase [Pseudomonadota bacterium]|nr:isoaspartyl peptidase/L-asparaginase [Pseudomonadota bacterium]
MSWKLVIHGGAGSIERSRISEEQDRDIRAALDRALAAGSGILESGATAVDAVVATVRVLEDDSHFNAGRGSVFTHDGAIELDAAIMEGRERSAGAVTGVTTPRNPVSLARAVMEKSEHVMLSGQGADDFAGQIGVEQAPAEYFATVHRRRQLEELKAGKLHALDVEYKYGTVGAVALDSSGNLAAATSTGGMTAKRWGRIGDSPMIGAGTYADNRSAAVSATGSGEYFIRAVAAHQLAERVRIGGQSLQQALDAALADVGALGGDGGLIAVSPAGEMAWGFTTPGMYRGCADAAGTQVALYSDEDER